MKLVNLSRLATSIVVLGLLASSIQAQQQNRRFQGGGRGGPGGLPGQDKLGLLTNEAVQKDLELADDQKADLKKIAEEAQQKARGLFGNFQGFRDLSEAEQEKRRTEMREKGDALGKEMMKKVEAVLLPHQMDRLSEINLQVRGTRALDDAEVEKALGITAQQKEKLSAVREEMGNKMREMFRGGQQEGGQDRFEALRKESTEKVMGVLTADQKAKFEKMKGQPFDVDAAGLRFGGRGGPGGRPGQPGQGGQGGQPRGNNANN